MGMNYSANTKPISAQDQSNSEGGRNLKTVKTSSIASGLEIYVAPSCDVLVCRKFDSHENYPKCSHATVQGQIRRERLIWMFSVPLRASNMMAKKSWRQGGIGKPLRPRDAFDLYWSMLCTLSSYRLRSADIMRSSRRAWEAARQGDGDHGTGTMTQKRRGGTSMGLPTRFGGQRLLSVASSQALCSFSGVVSNAVMIFVSDGPLYWSSSPR